MGPTKQQKKKETVFFRMREQKEGWLVSHQPDKQTNMENMSDWWWWSENRRKNQREEEEEEEEEEAGDGREDRKKKMEKKSKSKTGRRTGIAEIFAVYWIW